jgi:hypothetical protein
VLHSRSMNEKNRLLVTDGPVESKKWLVEIEGFRKVTDPSRRIYRTLLVLLRKIERCEHVRDWKH